MSEVVEKGVASLRRRILEGRFVEEPYPYLVLEPALDEELYNELEASFPASEIVYQGAEPQNNQSHLLSAREALDGGALPPVWHETISRLATPDFFRDALTALAPYTKDYIPEFEMRMGKKLEDCTMSVRRSGEKTDLYFDVQIGVNSPVSKVSSVRSVHVDKRSKIFNALLYMRHPEDMAEGGDLAVYVWDGPRRYGKNGATVSDDLVRKVGQVEYARNRLFMFQNSPDSLHGVTPRGVTPTVRRYINFLIIADRHLFDTTSPGEDKGRSFISGLGRKLFGKLAPAG